MPDTRGVTHYPLQSRNREEKRISLRFFPLGATTPDNATNIGWGAVVTRTGVGQYTVVFDKPYNKLVKASIECGHATLVQHGRVISIQVDANGACTGFTFQVYTDASPGVAVETASAATSWFSIEATVLNTANR